MGKIYKLLIYLKNHDQLLLVDMIYGEDWEYLFKMGQDRKQNNEQYIVLLLSYNLLEAKVV